MNWALENYNIASDARSRGPAEKPVLYFAGCLTCGEPVNEADELVCDCPEPEYAELERELDTKWAVCPVCRGEGKHVNPSLDAGGLSEEMVGDPEFMDDYMGGCYDQTCNRCRGKRVVPEVDWNALTAYERKAYEKQLRDDADYEAERLAEIRMGC